MSQNNASLDPGIVIEAAALCESNMSKMRQLSDACQRMRFVSSDDIGQTPAPPNLEMMSLISSTLYNTNSIIKSLLDNFVENQAANEGQHTDL